MASAEVLERFKRLMADPANTKCVDCSTPNPQWASAKYGCYFCLECSGRHRGLGVHIDFVRSVYMDSWKESEMRRMELGGNAVLTRLFMSKGIHTLPIETKYTSHPALLYREKLSSLAENRNFDEAAAMRGILDMEREIEARKARPTNHSISAPPSPHHTRTSGDDRGWDYKNINTSAILESMYSGTSVVADATKSLVSKISTPDGRLADYTTQSTQRAREIAGQGWGVVSSAVGTCLTSAQVTLNTMQQFKSPPLPPSTSPASNPSRFSWGTRKSQEEAAAAAGAGLPENPKDLSDLFGGNGNLDGGSRMASYSGSVSKTSDRFSDPNDLSDLFNRDRGGSGYSGPSRTTGPEDPRDLSDLLSGKQEYTAPVSNKLSALSLEQSAPTPTVSASAPVRSEAPRDDDKDWAWDGGWSDKGKPEEKKVVATTAAVTAGGDGPTEDDHSWAWKW
jgi:hypothetical protein